MSSLGDAVIEALKGFLEEIFGPVKKVIEDNADEVLAKIVASPAPDTVFGRPSNDAWPGMYDYYWSDIIPLALLLWSLSVGLVIFLESTNHLFSGYHQSRLKRRAFTGLMGILSWWWIAALSLRFMNALTGFIVPDLSEISMFQTLSFSAVGVLALVVSLSVDLVLLLLVAFVYLARQVTLYLFVLLMPLLIALWIPGIGPFSYLTQTVQKFAGLYVPFLIMPLPVAMLFQLADILGNSFGFTGQGVFLWLVALLIPIVAILSPFVLIWQAGSLLSMGERVGRHTSTARARGRANTARQYGGETVHSGRNVSRGVRGEPAVRRDGQQLISGGSRAHSAGTRLRAGGTTVRDRVSSAVSIERRESTSKRLSPREWDFEQLRPNRRSERSSTSRQRSSRGEDEKREKR